MGKALAVIVVIAAVVAAAVLLTRTDRAPDAGGADATGGAPTAAAGTLTIAWAQWAPSEVLEKMAKEWGKTNNVTVKLTQIPWSDYADKIFTDVFTGKSATYDIVVGDSQWLGKGADEGHYADVTDFVTALPNLKEYGKSALAYFCEYPTGSGKYFAAPCETDALGFSYRKDLFEDAKEQAAFKAKFNRDLAVPTTWQELRDVAGFFQRPDQNLYGVALFTNSGGYDAVTMGFQSVMWAWGGAYCDPATYKVDGVLNSAKGVQALEFYTELCQNCTPPGSTNYYHSECLKAFQTGQVAMAVNYFALMPLLVDEKMNKFAKSTGYFACPKGPEGRFASLGGQGLSIIKYAKPEQQELAKKFIAWFLQTDQQKRWALNPGCFSANTEALKGDAFLKAAPFNQAFADSLPLLRDFYNLPEHAQLLESTQKNWNGAIVGTISPQAAMDAIAKDHETILRKAGRLK
ncbi:MAG: sugar ABC transporter substrate-binding protein [Planctomycetes bacterium]|nr:sugar ABC transporter substrate-binding protein [Planctomycetota bacterium]